MPSENWKEQYAKVLLWGLYTARSSRFKKGDIILVRYGRPGIEMAEQLQKEILALGMNPVLRMTGTCAMERHFFELADNSQIDFNAPGEKELYEHLNGSIYLLSPESLTHLSHIDPERIARSAIARKIFREILDRREEKGLFGWTLGIVPTPELARHAKMRLSTYTAQWKKACFLDDEDPVARWKEIFQRAKALKDWLNSLDVEALNVRSANTDMTIFPGRQRRWIGISGHNIPSFEIFLSPDCRKTTGVYYADQPSYRNGHYVSGVRLVFENGSVRQIDAQSGKEFVEKQAAMDEGASRIGEFSLTDKRFSRISRFMANTLFDENYGGRNGNCHIALGASYSDTFSGDVKSLTPKKKAALGFNDSALHWDLVNTEKKVVTATLTDGSRQVIYENGCFTGPY